MIFLHSRAEITHVNIFLSYSISKNWLLHTNLGFDLFFFFFYDFIVVLLWLVIVSSCTTFYFLSSYYDVYLYLDDSDEQSIFN